MICNLIFQHNIQFNDIFTFIKYLKYIDDKFIIMSVNYKIIFSKLSPSIYVIFLIYMTLVKIYELIIPTVVIKYA